MEKLNITPTPLFIAGPTASGKSGLAIKLAMRLREAGRDVAIINADSMQVYQELRIITARPSVEDEALVPHHLYGHRAGDKPYSTGVWAKEAVAQIEACQAAGIKPILVGGTGMYFKALEEGLSPIPDVPLAIRDQGNALYAEMGGANFKEMVVANDAEMQRLPENDRQRLVRAFEVYEATGKPLSYFQNIPRQPLLNEAHGQIGKVMLIPERDILYGKINRRFAQMAELGALEEVRALMKQGYSANDSVMKSLGVPEFIDHLNGVLTLEEAIDKAQMMTRRFAKRQLTWFRGIKDQGWEVMVP